MAEGKGFLSGKREKLGLRLSKLDGKREVKRTLDDRVFPFSVSGRGVDVTQRNGKAGLA